MSKKAVRVVGVSTQPPWQRGTYEYHRSRVKNAKSTIDMEPPKDRPHVLYDAKKTQYERERQAEIARENFILLRKLHEIMHRRDNRLLREKSLCVRTR